MSGVNLTNSVPKTILVDNIKIISFSVQPYESMAFVEYEEYSNGEPVGLKLITIDSQDWLDLAIDINADAIFEKLYTKTIQVAGLASSL